MIPSLTIVVVFVLMTAFFVWIEGYCTTRQAIIMCRVIFALILMFACYDIYQHEGVYWKW